MERGTSALLVGGAGVGKSSIAVTYAVGAARRGEQVAMFAFDEGLGTLFARASGPPTRPLTRFHYRKLYDVATTSVHSYPRWVGEVKKGAAARAATPNITRGEAAKGWHGRPA